ncbi:deoxyribose-phosphate aldolase [Rhizoctonia solani AG-1 IA]|uniref:Deoxyribose-phosphate aldolase n=1 Tax=Thanatephorus cucumeris (strain AG1-IA) TaxID=983506 RepID=L8X988_THACA|nr:deoxyribose-phosphate aldolase [Rhizoctonia solani AG-1 IA]
MPTVKLDITLKDLSKMIDVSLLHPTMTDGEILAGLQDARTYDAAAACVKPYAVTMALEALEGTSVKVCPVIGFPAGNSTTAVKVYEATEVVKEIGCSRSRHGALQLIHSNLTPQMIMGKLGDQYRKSTKRGLGLRFRRDWTNQRSSDRRRSYIKSDLRDPDIIRLCEICSAFGVGFVKTSTGYGFNKQSNGMYSYAGATDHNLKLMRQHSSEKVQIKAAGGVRTLDDLLRVRALGVTRVGATATKEILQEAVKRGIGKEPKTVEVTIPE